ncbi:hypothetical protein F7725_007348 [Dissostichus mawsoni]|uniref:Protein Wnt n=1 Tax=Dissostichus mawsoni TaxID=36200 RepID=A0A7J5XWK0_DISMA|nr:hypothetical protein F7725_007348 [Dissostichus mawsoni]
MSRGVRLLLSIRTCWRGLQDLREIAMDLKIKYLSATKVVHRPLGTRKQLVPKDIDIRPVRDNELVDSCDLMCCGRGYNPYTEKLVERCHCKYHWCCYVTCKKCERIVERYGGSVCREQTPAHLHTGLSVDSLKDSSVTGIPQHGISKYLSVVRVTPPLCGNRLCFPITILQPSNLKPPPHTPTQCRPPAFLAASHGSLARPVLPQAERSVYHRVPTFHPDGRFVGGISCGL